MAKNISFAIMTFCTAMNNRHIVSMRGKLDPDLKYSSNKLLVALLSNVSIISSNFRELLLFLLIIVPSVFCGI